jgi:hypothetical protein
MLLFLPPEIMTNVDVPYRTISNPTSDPVDWSQYLSMECSLFHGTPLGKLHGSHLEVGNRHGQILHVLVLYHVHESCREHWCASDQPMQFGELQKGSAFDGINSNLQVSAVKNRFVKH